MMKPVSLDPPPIALPMAVITKIMAMDEVTRERVVVIYYQNYEGKTAWRAILPRYAGFMAVEPWHPKPCWMWHATDIEKNSTRTFPMDDIAAWHSWAHDKVIGV